VAGWKSESEAAEKALKIMAIVVAMDGASVSTHAENHHEVRWYRLFDFYMIEAKPEKLDRRSRL